MMPRRFCHYARCFHFRAASCRAAFAAPPPPAPIRRHDAATAMPDAPPPLRLRFAADADAARRRRDYACCRF